MWINKKDYNALISRIEMLENQTNIKISRYPWENIGKFCEGKASDNYWSTETNKPINELVIEILKYLNLKLKTLPSNSYLIKKENNESFS